MMSAYIIGKNNIISQELSQLDDVCHMFLLTRDIYSVEGVQYQTSSAQSMTSLTVVTFALQRMSKLFNLVKFETINW